MENESEGERGEWRRLVEAVVKRNLLYIDDQYQCQPHPGLEGKGQQQLK